MCVVFQSKDAQDFVVFMHGLAKISSFLLVVPVGVRISMLSLDPRRIYITTVLYVSSACLLNLAAHRNYHLWIINFPNGLVGREVPYDIARNICSLTRCD